MFYLYVITETDGNDARKYDCIVEAEDRESADNQLHSHFNKLAEEKNWDSDGDMGYYFPCDCELPELPEETFPCPQCEAIAINGVNCHETECPIDREIRKVQKQIDNFECQGHGGLDIDSYNVEEYATEEEAEDNLASYHSRYYL